MNHDTATAYYAANVKNAASITEQACQIVPKFVHVDKSRLVLCNKSNITFGTAVETKHFCFFCIVYYTVLICS